jgi:hypothetical protein
VPGIYDNISARLLPALKQTLADSERADFSVGYFNLRGWKLIDDLVDRLEGTEASRVRLLVGMQRAPEDELRSAMSLLPDGDEISLQKALRLRRQVADEFRRQLVQWRFAPSFRVQDVAIRDPGAGECCPLRSKLQPVLLVHYCILRLSARKQARGRCIPSRSRRAQSRATR